MLHINKGVYKGERIISENVLGQIITPVMPDYWGGNPSVLHPAAAMGWFTYAYRGHSAVSHGGFFGSSAFFLPDEGIGIYFLPSLNSCAHEVIAFHIYDVVLGLSILDWNGSFQGAVANNLRNYEEARAKEAAEKTVEEKKPHSFSISEYVGLYEHPAYMKLDIILKEDMLIVEKFADSLELRHKSGESFELIEENNPVALLTFLADADGKIISLASPIQDGVSDIVFTRIN